MQKETKELIESAQYELSVLHDRLRPTELSWTDRQMNQVMKLLREALENESLYEKPQDITYGRIPVGLIQGFDGIVFYFQTTDAYNTKVHEDAVKSVIENLIDDSQDHGTYWELTKIEAVVWNERSQVSVASFRVRDSY